MLNQEAYQRTMALPVGGNNLAAQKLGRFSASKDTVIARSEEKPAARSVVLPPARSATRVQQWNKLKLVKEIAKTVWGK